METTRRNISMPDDLWIRITGACMKEEQRTGEAVSASQFIRRAVRDYLDERA